jgi:hypothetical protein
VQKLVGAGAFGGGREGVQQAELQRGTLSTIGQSLGTGFQTALGAAQRQQQVGLAAGQQLGQIGRFRTTNGSGRYKSVNGWWWITKKFSTASA